MRTLENPFKSEDRKYPVNFAYPWEDNFLINIEIPEGYRVESLPKPIALGLPENLGTFKYNISQNGGTINLKASLEINSALIAPQYYSVLKEFYKQLVEKETEKVVLSKISPDEHTERTAGGR